MNWKKKMAVAMLMMKEACRENTEWSNCANCPFDEYCDIIMQNSNGMITPTAFEIEKEEE